MSDKNPQFKPEKTPSISRRFSYALIGVVTLMLVGFAAGSIIINSSRMNKKLTDQLDNMLKLSETSLVTPLWNFDVNSINGFVDALFLDKSIACVRVLDDSDVVSERVSSEFKGNGFDFFESSPQFIAKTSYITHQDKKIGSIQLALSRKSVKQESLVQMFAIIALTVFIITAIALTSVIITRRYISKPLLKLRDSTTKIANGDLEIVIDTSSRDEIGKLAYNLNVMRKSIKELFSAYRESNEKFEESNRILSNSRARISAIVETAADGIITIDKDGIIESFNPAAERIFGYSASEAVGEAVSLLTTSTTKDEHLKYWRPGKNGTGADVREVVGIKKGGAGFPMDLAVSEVHLGEQVLYTGIVHDITERKRAEQLQADYNLTLEKEVAERTDELSKAIRNLKMTQNQLVEAEKMASLGGLVAGIAHEINTPIGIGVTLASLLDNDTSALRDSFENNRMKRSELQKFIDKATQSSAMLMTNLNRAAELIQSFKQVAVDQTAEVKRSFAFKAYLNDALLSLRPKLKHKQHRIVIEGDDSLSLNSYPGVFSQIVTNLLMNSLAHAYGPDDNGVFHFSFKKEGANLKFQYSDDGRGIPEENIAKIFDPFFTTRRGQGGSGLGLHIIYNLVTQKLGGTISCESEKGKGAKFIITVPLDPVG